MSGQLLADAIAKVTIANVAEKVLQMVMHVVRAQVVTGMNLCKNIIRSKGEEGKWGGGRRLRTYQVT